MKEMKRGLVALLAAILIAILAGVGITAFWSSSGSSPLRLGLAPYQDLAMIVNIKPLGLDKKYNTQVELVTMGWEEILPSVATLGRGLDVGFASYVEYLTKYNNINAAGADPLLFVFPVYVFKGGAFVTFRDDVPQLTAANIRDKSIVSQFLNKKIGAQKSSLYDMMIFRLSRLNDIDLKSVQLIDTPMDQGFLAAQQGSLDIASAGLTQLTETLRRGGRSVLTMDDLQFADFTGFVVKKSVYEKRKKEVDDLIRMWFDCVDFVYSDIDKNSKDSLAYLNGAASTRYTLEEYKLALSQEYLPRTLSEAKQEFLSENGKFPYQTIGRTAVDYLLLQGTVRVAPPIGPFIDP